MRSLMLVRPKLVSELRALGHILKRPIQRAVTSGLGRESADLSHNTNWPLTERISMTASTALAQGRLASERQAWGSATKASWPPISRRRLTSRRSSFWLPPLTSPAETKSGTSCGPERTRSTWSRGTFRKRSGAPSI